MAKKINKVETPIDQRETFVSIQKNFADSDISVEEKLRTLYELQKADTAIDKILQLRGALPAEVGELEDNIADIRHRLEETEDRIEGYNLSITTDKQNIIEAETAISKYQKQLENISNSREYDSINKEIENQDLLRKIAEKKITEAKQSILDLKEELEDIKSLLSVKQQDLEAKKEELSTIIEDTAAEEKKLVKERDTYAKKIDDRTMSAYNRIRQSVNNHLAVVGIFNNDSCGGCFNTVIPQRLIDIQEGKKLVICEHCGRIIVGASLE